MVLVQWEGLHPDEASWEDWATLKDIHHLEKCKIGDLRSEKAMTYIQA